MAINKLRAPLGKLISRAERIGPRHSRPLRLWYERLFGEFELRLVPMLCSPKRTSFDVGANRGVFAELMLRHSLDVVAFEPNPRVAAQLRRAFRNAILVEQCALSDRDGQVELLVPIHAEGFALDGHATLSAEIAAQFSDAERVTVPARRLDCFRGRNVGFIKIDVEGHEMSVLAGGRSLIDEQRPNLLLECEERHVANAVQNVESFMRQLGYFGFFVFHRRLLPVREFDAQVHQRLEAPHGDYINNFIYLPNSDAAPAIDQFVRHL
jgi:FkbM family methyltransferase